jgi:hypothetical protein
MEASDNSFSGEGLIAERVAGMRKDWVKHADQVLEDE